MKRRNGFTMIEILMVIGMLIIVAAIGMTAIRQFTDLSDQRKAEIAALRVKTLCEATWSKHGIDGPESARIEMAIKTLEDQGVNTATVTDWSADALKARVPTVDPPKWDTKDAMDLMGWKMEEGVQE